MSQVYNSQLEVSRIDQTDSLNIAFPIVMRRVYALMTLALFISGITAFLIATSDSILYYVFTNQWLFWGVLISQLVIVFILSATLDRISYTLAKLLFLLYACVTGVSISFIFCMCTYESIASTFVITGLTFGITSLYGYVTKKDLSSWRNILFMGLIGILIASLANLILQSTTVMWITTYVGIIVFVGLTAYDTQKIKNMIEIAGDDVDNINTSKIALFGSLILYLDFINLFLRLLRIFGRRK